MKYVEVPLEKLNEELLLAVIEEFIQREGTDYGHGEYSQDSKIQQVKKQMEKGRAKLVFDLETQSCTIVRKEDFHEENEEI